MLDINCIRSVSNDIMITTNKQIDDTEIIISDKLNIKYYFINNTTCKEYVDNTTRTRLNNILEVIVNGYLIIIGTIDICENSNDLLTIDTRASMIMINKIINIALL